MSRVAQIRLDEKALLSQLVTWVLLAAWLVLQSVWVFKPSCIVFYLGYCPEVILTADVDEACDWKVLPFAVEPKFWAEVIVIFSIWI